MYDQQYDELKAGKPGARDALIAALLPLVEDELKRFAGARLHAEDLRNEGIVAVCEAVHSMETEPRHELPNPGYFASKRIKWRMISYLRSARRNGADELLGDVAQPTKRNV